MRIFNFRDVPKNVKSRKTALAFANFCREKLWILCFDVVPNIDAAQMSSGGNDGFRSNPAHGSQRRLTSYS